MKKQFAVLGLGSFGRSVALTLESLGCDVFVVDKSSLYSSSSSCPRRITPAISL